MKVTSVSIKKIESEFESKVKGYASVILDDCLAIHDIRIIEGSNRQFIAFPSKKTTIKEELKFFDYVHPIVQSLREEIESAVLNEFNK